MSRNFAVHQDEPIAQSHSKKILSNIRHSQASSSSSETPISGNKDSQPSTLKDTDNKTAVLSHIRHFNISDELLDSMEEQRLENYT